MKAILTAAGLALIAATGAAAQPTPAPAAPYLAGPSPNALQLAHDLVVASGVEKTLEAITNAMAAPIAARQAQRLPPERRDDAPAMLAAAQEAMTAFFSGLLDRLADFYADNLTEDEMVQVLAFDNSPAGKDMIAKGPQVVLTVTGFAGTEGPRLSANIAARFCAETGCTPAERAALSGPPPVVPAAAPQTPAPSPHAVALAAQMIAAGGLGKSFETLSGNMATPVMQLEVARLPADRRAQAPQMEAAVKAEVAAFYARIFDRLAVAYAASLSEDEMSQLLAFYVSPAGQAVAAKAPLLVREIQVAIIDQAPLLPGEIVDRFCAKTSCTPEQKTALLAPPARAAATP